MGVVFSTYVTKQNGEEGSCVRSLSLEWLKQEQVLQLVLIPLGQTNKIASAESAATSTLFCICESLFLLHPLTNYWSDFVGSHFQPL